MSQLSLLSSFYPEPEIELEKEYDFWKVHFGWTAKVGEMARINITIANKETLGDSRYCYCMRVKILSISAGIALCETTKEWEEATNGSDKAGELLRVEVKDLAPILKSR